MHKRATALAVVGLAAALGAGAGTASAEPNVMVLPDATLYCGSTVVEPGQWVFHNGPTLWITSGPLTGHYVWLASAHYLQAGLMVHAPTGHDYATALPLGSDTFGLKTGIRGNAIECQFVSRWDLPGEENDFTVFGPLTMARVSG